MCCTRATRRSSQPSVLSVSVRGRPTEHRAIWACWPASYPPDHASAFDSTCRARCSNLLERLDRITQAGAGGASRWPARPICRGRLGRSEEPYQQGERSRSRHCAPRLAVQQPHPASTGPEQMTESRRGVASRSRSKTVAAVLAGEGLRGTKGHGARRHREGTKARRHEESAHPRALLTCLHCPLRPPRLPLSANPARPPRRKPQRGSPPVPPGRQRARWLRRNSGCHRACAPRFDFGGIAPPLRIPAGAHWAIQTGGDQLKRHHSGSPARSRAWSDAQCRSFSSMPLTR